MPTSTLRLLVVDDDELVRRALARGLRRTFNVVDVGSAREEIARIAEGAEFDAVLTDVEMPMISGRDFITWLENHAPLLAARTVVLTGGPRDPHLAAWVASLPQERRLVKPAGLPAVVALLLRAASARI